LQNGLSLMSDSTIQDSFTGVSRLKLFWALSRTPHGLLDMCAPALGALLGLGSFPPLRVIILGAITTFAGYTAVYALNDVIDYGADREKAAQGGFADSEIYLDGVLVRHPMAWGLLSFREGLLWALAWASVALVGAYILNPVCVLIFLGACFLEAIYCWMWRVSPFRTLVSGVVKTSGAIAAVFAVNPNPPISCVGALFLWLFFWEIGGQNIPADWTDIEEDRRLNAQTIPVRFGPQRANLIILGTIVLSLCMSGVIFYFSPVHFNVMFIILGLSAGCYLLLLPALSLYKSKERARAMALFNKASYYPLILLIVAVLTLLIK
jgi:4-hydroxybenzoate polyprenyltransferase